MSDEGELFDMMDRLFAKLDVISHINISLQVEFAASGMSYKEYSLDKYLKTKGTPERSTAHEEYMKNFESYSVLPRLQGPFAMLKTFNPLYDIIWSPYAKKLEYLGMNELSGFGFSYEGDKFSESRKGGMIFSFAIPSTPVLEYMVNVDKPIVEIGSGLGYWAALLSALGANVTAVDPGYEDIADTTFHPPIREDGIQFIKNHEGIKDSALFLCWPRPAEQPQEYDNMDPIPVAERCLIEFKGNDVFYVGEGPYSATFYVPGYLEDIDETGFKWVQQKVLTIPTWPGLQDRFVHMKKIQN